MTPNGKPDTGAMLVQVPQDTDSLSEAATMVGEGGLILIDPGIYEEEMLITTKDVTVRGTDRNEVIIDGGGVRASGVAATADGIRIENLTVRNTTFYGVLVTGLSDESGALARGGDGYQTLDPDTDAPLERFSIDHVTAYNNGLYGIYAFHARHGVIRDSYASGSADSGFYVGQCTDCDTLVENNVAERNAIGFENANASDSLVLANNRFAHNRVGLTLMTNYQEAFVPQRGNVVVGNLIAHNIEPESPRQAQGGFGIGIGIAAGKDNLITLNRITGNPYAGVSFASTEDLGATGNALVDNTYARNGIDVLNESAPRAPAVGNCVGTTHQQPKDFAPRCPPDLDLRTPPERSDSGPKQPAGTAPNPVEEPAGMSFLKVSPPPDQPSMEATTQAPPALPGTSPVPMWPDAAPGPDFLADRSGVK